MKTDTPQSYPQVFHGVMQNERVLPRNAKKNFWQKERHFRLATMRKLWSIFFCRMQVISKKLIHAARVNCLLVLLASFGTVFVLFQG